MFACARPVSVKMAPVARRSQSRSTARLRERGPARTVVFVLLTALLASGCTGWTRPKGAQTYLKPPVQGLLDRHGFPEASHTEAVRAFVVNTTWASLQPTLRGAIVRPNDIDRAIEQARRSGMTLKLRVRAGIHAPEWAKRIGGPPIALYYTGATVRSAGRLAGTIGRFWHPEFGAAYADLQARLAALYDAVPEVRQTGVTRCGTIFTESYLRNTGEPRNMRALVAAGFTRSADDRCHDEQITAHLVWQRTRSGVAFNPYQAIEPDGRSKVVDLPYTLAEMERCRAVLGPRCVLENHSLSSERLSVPEYAAMYDKMRELGPPYDFQTATRDKIGNYQHVLDWAAAFGASSVELPVGYRDWPPSVLTPYRIRLAANPLRG
jgi:hypothetical protein